MFFIAMKLPVCARLCLSNLSVANVFIYCCLVLCEFNKPINKQMEERGGPEGRKQRKGEKEEREDSRKRKTVKRERERERERYEWQKSGNMATGN